MSETKTNYKPVNATPVKSFFVSMLTRDIKLEEAILDLLDNCVDGIHRSGITDSSQPYAGRWAQITFSQDTFMIADNCGGIPWSESEYAFRMGRDQERSGASTGIIGVYGIGMKRAIFKMGKKCLISTRSLEDEYEVEILPEWIDDENEWDIPVNPATTHMNEDGTTILVGELHAGISARFNEDKNRFQSELHRLISTHYSLIIEKGFTVSVNGTEVKPKTRKLLFTDTEKRTDQVIRPYMCRAVTEDNVEVFMAVGFTQRIPSTTDIENEQIEKRYSTEDAGWTIICNDRTVLHCDRSELTGWGDAGVPRYHTQFIAISGYVEFRCDDPAKLPTTTTKRGVDASSVLYLQAKNKMRDGMKIFTDYTNRWKGRVEETQEQFEAGEPLTFAELKVKSESLTFNSISGFGPNAAQLRPSLPRPKRIDTGTRKIGFSKTIEEIAQVREFMSAGPRASASEVGEKCFDAVLESAS